MREHARNADFARSLRSSMTDAEIRLWFHLRTRRFIGLRFRRQHPVGAYIVDFACLHPRLVVELDGSQHLHSLRDAARDASLRAAGFGVLRFWNDDVLLRTDEVLAAVLAAVQSGT